MGDNLPIIEKAKAYCMQVLDNEIPDHVHYHSRIHTEEVVASAIEIGKNTGLSPEQIEILELAAWFHDLGYRETVKNHEQVSTQIAIDFLHKQAYDEEKIMGVCGCIMATKMPQSPKNIMEEALCDADLLHLGKRDYFKKSDLLQKEIEQIKGEKIEDKDWMKMNKDFIRSHQFFTPYARKVYKAKQEKNLEAVTKKLKLMKEDKRVEKLQSKIEELKEKVIEAKEQKPTRGIETMFRLTSRNHLELSAMADNKANIMISINSIILSVLVSILFRKLEEYPYMTVPALLLTIVCLATIVFSILATRPNITKGKFTKEDILGKKTNLLFFGNFHSMKLEDYEWGMKEMMKDADYLYSSLTRDIYFLGAVLGKKYRLLRISYTIFMFGFVLSIVSFVIAELFFKGPSPY